MKLKTDKFVNLPVALKDLDQAMHALTVAAVYLMQNGPHGPVSGFEVGVVGGIMDSLDAFQGMLKETYTDEFDDEPEQHSV